jgi:hypothetical protein
LKHFNVVAGWLPLAVREGIMMKGEALHDSSKHEGVTGSLRMPRMLLNGTRPA